MSRSWALAAVLMSVVCLGTGCSQKKPAEQAVALAEQSLADVSEESLKYLPKRYLEVKVELDAARQALGEEKYAEAIAAAEALPARARELGEAAAAAREALAAELKVDWVRLTGTLPGQIDALETRVAELARARRLPKGVDRDAVDEAKSGAEVSRLAWTEATAAHDKGNLEGAVARGQESERLVVEMMALIGMTPPAADKPAS